MASPQASLSTLAERSAAVVQRAEQELLGVTTAEAAAQKRAAFLGKKGHIADLMKILAEVPPDQRRELGRVINDAKQALEARFDALDARLGAAALAASLQATTIDVTRPARERWAGTLHPLTRTMQQVLDALIPLGFSVANGPEVEHDFYNFSALNFPKDHPARAMQDTFFISPEVLLRTHTSPVQIRTMLQQKAPVRVLCPGRVYRCDADITHSPMFHQVEGLWVDKEVSMSDLKGVLRAFSERLFGAGAKVRLRPSFFPFVEPGVEVDVSCVMCRGSGCRVCKQTGWLEILGAGMVHPNVFTSVGYQPEEVRGFAFGMGVERIAMLLHGVDDIRLFFDNDLRFLRQFA